jgi:hypothetical protein
MTQLWEFRCAMSYSDFTLDSAARLLGVVSRPADLFPDLRPVSVTPWLKETLARGTQGIQLSLISEKSRSEFIVAPILLASREASGNRFVIYSGQRLDVDAEKGLVGECDFILSATDPVLPLQAPIATVVEAKKNDYRGGVGSVHRPDGRRGPFQPGGGTGRPPRVRLRDHRRGLAVRQARGLRRAAGASTVLHRHGRPDSGCLPGDHRRLPWNANSGGE